MIMNPQIHAAILAKLHGGGAAHAGFPVAPAGHLAAPGMQAPPVQAGFPVHPAAQLEMAKQGVKDNLKRVRHQELGQELGEMHKARSGDIEKEQSELFNK